MSRAVAIEARNLTRVYTRGAEEITSVNDVFLRIDEGDFVSVIGPSGSGKTTLTNLLGCLDNPTSGTLSVGDRPIFGGGRRLSESALTRIRRETFGYVFQNFYLIPTLTVIENVMLPLTFYRKPGTKDDALALLRLLGIDGRKDHLPGQISGGEMQRVAIARAMVNRPESSSPTSRRGTSTRSGPSRSSGPEGAEPAAGLTIVMVTHNPELARQAGRTIEMRDGRISEA